VEAGLSLGFGTPSGFGPVVSVARHRGGPLLLTSLHYDEDMVWSNGETALGENVNRRCRRRRSVIIAAAKGGEWTWHWVAAFTVNAPRGIVSMSLDAT